MGEPELYLIKLLRKAVHAPLTRESADAQDNCADEPAEGSEVFNTFTPEPTDGAAADGKKQEDPYLAMDYFDALIPRKIKTDEDINEFMDIDTSSDYGLSKFEVAMQSIPIYCSAKDIEKYGYEVPLNECDFPGGLKAAPYGNPFEQQDNYPYLSLVQIYIMPEVMARIKLVSTGDESGTATTNRVTAGIINQFYEDIYSIIDGYVSKHYLRDPFVCRVYRSLSAGDFTVAVSSNRPETAFILATLFRERGTCYAGSEKPKYVFYKTYTLLSCNKKWIADNIYNSDAPAYEDSATDPGKHKDGFNVDGRFVLRVTFNNNYWANAATENGRHDFDRLNGRYDFSVTLTENAFRYVSKTLYNYKLASQGLLVPVEEDEKHTPVVPADLGDEVEICKKLIELIRTNEYVTYVNERYVFKCDNLDIFQKDSEDRKTAISLNDRTIICDWLSVANDKAISRVEKRLESVFSQVMQYDTNRRNMFYHLKLLRQMLNLCCSINGLSDTRIYCAILINQINVVLDGMEDSYQVLAAQNNRRFISITEHALSEAVVSLNTYSKLIRDNNLQSLQTPNYNLESTVSMEKILVGYGELLNSLFKWYEKTNLCEEIFGLRQQYTPFVIPGNQDESLQTKVLFKEAKPTFPNEKLMVVWCSNFKDLTNFGGTVGILFHEVAHNLRYRARFDRNRIVMQYLTYLICDQITMSIVDNLQQGIPELRESVGLSKLICDSLYNAYNKVIYEDRDIMRLAKDMSYASVIDFIKNEYDKFTEVIRQINNVDRFIRQCISLRSETNNRERDEALERVRILRSALVYNRRPSYSRKSISSYNDKNARIIEGYMKDAVAALETYLQASENEAHFVDVSAKLIYEALLANLSLGTELKEMFNRYGLVDRFFAVLSEQLDAEARALEEDDKNKVLALETRKVFQYLTRGSFDADVSQSILEAYISPHITRTQMEAVSIMNQASEIYSEVCSDLFMYNLVEMTPFGYFSFLTEYSPSDARTAHTFIRRLCLVMYAAFSGPAKGLKNSKDKRRYWWGLIERLYNDFVMMADKSLAALSLRCKKFDKIIIEVDTEIDNRRRQSLSYWCEFIRAHITDYKDRYFEKREENELCDFDYFSDVYHKAREERELKDLFAKRKHIGRSSFMNEDGKVEDLFADDLPDKASLSLEHILSKYEEDYFHFVRGYIGSVYEEISNSPPTGEIKTGENGVFAQDGRRNSKRELLRELEFLRDEMSRLGYMSFFLKRLYIEIHQEIATLERLDYLAADYRYGFSNTRRLHDEFVRDEASGGCWMKPYFEEVKELLNHPELRYDTRIRKRTNIRMIEMVSELYYRAIHNAAVDAISECE